MSLGNTPHIRLFLDKDGQLYIYDQDTKEKRLISMRLNRDGTKTSRALASEIENSIWEFRWDHQKRGAEKKRQQEEVPVQEDDLETVLDLPALPAHQEVPSKAESKPEKKAKHPSEPSNGRQKVSRPKSARLSHAR